MSIDASVLQGYRRPADLCSGVAIRADLSRERSWQGHEAGEKQKSTKRIAATKEHSKDVCTKKGITRTSQTELRNVGSKTITESKRAGAL
eukprot:6128421-Amphidinium_carterae.1